MVLVIFFAGLALLVGGARVLVDGASKLALTAGLSPLVVGLTVVAFGTSSPELAVSVQASWGGQADMALGNIIGSNIFNILFVLGASALLLPLAVSSQLVRFDVPVMVVISFLLFAVSLNGQISMVESSVLFVLLLGYVAGLIYFGRIETPDIEPVAGAPSKAMVFLKSGAAIVVGLALLVLGSNWLVESAVTFARIFGVSEVIIGLTIVAAGTSLPELATSVIAAIRGERDIAVGNVVGSNLFNILGVGGLTGLASGQGLPVHTSLLHFDLLVMIAVAVACLPIFIGRRIARWQGGLFLFYYFAYTAYIVMAAIHHDALDTYTLAMTWFVIPLTAITLLVSGYRALRNPQRHAIS